MSYWVVIFEDTDGMLEHRKAHGAAHIAYLTKHADQIVTGGGFRQAQESPFVGGLWIVKNATRHEVEELVLNDPYYSPDLRSYRIFYWGKAIDREVTV